jgi:hypothetical protein
MFIHTGQTKFRKDNWDWEKRADGKTTREDHAKLKVDGISVSVDFATQLTDSVFMDATRMLHTAPRSTVAATGF